MSNKRNGRRPWAHTDSADDAATTATDATTEDAALNTVDEPAADDAQSVEEIVADYMTSYVNYYGIDPVAEADKYNMIAEKNVMDMLRTVCGLEKNASLEGVDLADGAAKYLTDHGMAADAVESLKNNLK